ncbi:hypothetical protein AB431_03575 [Mycobacterium sp. EPa45]|nr:hypothetical protein AB431_03575 [Mycobacterium sp. EPa45]
MSFVTDALYGAGDVVSAVAEAVSIGTDLALGLNYYWDDSDFGAGVPVNPVFLAAAALQNPGSAVSYLAQLLLNPSDNYANYTYPWYFKTAVVDPLVALLPTALASAVSNAVNGVADGINDAFGALPDPTAAVTALADMYSTPAGRAVYAVQNAIALPVTLLTAVTYYLAYLPASVEATAESAIQNPAEIPGLLSKLVYNALDPDLYDGLLGNLSYNLIKPALFLPAPIGESSLGAHDGLAWNLYDGFATAVNGLLSRLPAPITPTPFAAAAAAAAASATPTASAVAKANDTAVKEDSASTDQTSTDVDGTNADVQAAETPNTHAQVHPGRKAVTPEHKSAKQGQAGKSDGHASGQGRSARPGKSDNAA